MGNPSYPVIDSLKEMVQGNEGKSRPSQLVVRKRKVTPRNGGHLMRKKRCGNVILIKRSRAPLEGDNKRSARRGIKSRVRTLKKLVPNSESMELDVLFRETADYIMSLEMRVRVMQTMVQLLTGSN